MAYHYWNGLECSHRIADPSLRGNVSTSSVCPSHQMVLTMTGAVLVLLRVPMRSSSTRKHRLLTLFDFFSPLLRWSYSSTLNTPLLLVENFGSFYSAMAPTSASFHYSARREEEAKEPTSSELAKDEGFLGTGISHLYAIPFGVMAAVPILEFQWFRPNEEMLVREFIPDKSWTLESSNSIALSLFASSIACLYVCLLLRCCLRSRWRRHC